MKKQSIVLASLAGILMFSGLSQAQDEENRAIDFDLVINALPASVLIDMTGDKFKTTGDDGFTTASMSQVFTMPNIAAGVGMRAGESWYVDATVGPGIVINDTFRSIFFQGILAANYLVSDSFQLGPRIGLVQHIDPEWTEDDNLNFDSSTGYMIGIWTAMGDRVKYFVSVDYIATEFDVEVLSGTATDDTYDLGGLAVQFGVRGEF